MRNEKIAIIGGGMSGMAAAILLAEAGKRVVIFERQERIGKKLLLTGNGRCNISNTDMDTSYYRTDETERLKRILQHCTPEQEADFWQSLGMAVREIKGGLYPETNQAATVLDCLRFRIEELGIRVCTDTYVTQIRGSLGHFMICRKDAEGTEKTEEGYTQILLCCGGLAGVYKEAEQNGFGIVRGMGHAIRKGHPALVPVTCSEDMKAIAGVRAQAKVTLFQNGREVLADTGELQLTKEGISGIPVFQLTRYLDEIKNSRFEVDFLPFLAEEELPKILNERTERMRERTMEQFFAGWLQKKLTLYLLKRCEVRAEQKLEALSEKQLLRVVQGMKHCSFTPAALGNYRQAQVSVGGVPLSEVNEHLQSVKVPGIYITGEMLDVTGACGGYNLHFALASAMTAVHGILPSP